MIFDDQQLIAFIQAGLTDDEILKLAHEETTPADLYGAVAELVTQFLFEDTDPEMFLMESGSAEVKLIVKYLQEISGSDELVEVRQWWYDMGVTRSDTKNIVMTYLYGSTEYGNRDGIQDRIEERAEECLEKGLDAYFDREGADIWKEQRTLAVTMMVKLVRGSMALVCPSTVETMNWIQTLAEQLGERDVPMTWKTYNNFTVTQDNPNLIRKQVRCRENGKTVMTLIMRVPAKDGKRYSAKKMAAGAAPNFIHSWDACHLQCVAIETDSQYFMMIHDSMSTQCVDTPEMAYQIRATFVTLYGGDSDVLYDVWDINDGDAYDLPEPEPMGDFEVEEVMDSEFFFH